MTADSYSLLLLNGQSIPISNFAGELNRFEFESSIDLRNERSCWLRDARKSELTEIRILQSESQSPRSWRYVAEAIDASQKTPPAAGSSRRGLRRFLMPWSRA